MPEESPARRAPSCVVTGLFRPESTHPEGHSTSAQATAGTVILVSRLVNVAICFICLLWLLNSLFCRPHNTGKNGIEMLWCLSVSYFGFECETSFL